MSIRISTNTLFQTGTNRLGELQTRLYKLQEQISTGKRVLTPSDDPIGAAQALQLNQSQALNAQFATNRTAARNSLELEEHVLQSVTARIQDMQALAVSAGNGALDEEQRKFLATELAGRLEDLLGLANSRDGNGNYIFAGFDITDQPFQKVATGAEYQGDAGQRRIQVGPARMLEINNPGSAVFETIKTGNGIVTAAAGKDNGGTGVVGTASLAGTASGDSYLIEFPTPGTYVVRNRTTNEATEPAEFVAGDALVVGEFRLTITGAPASGDEFEVGPSKNQSLFETVTDMIAALNAPATDAASKTRLRNNLNQGMSNLANALDNVLSVRAGVGARLQEIDSLDEQGAERDMLYAKSLQEIQDLDYTAAISDLTKQKIMLEAAQQSFVQTSRLSLFNYMS